MDKTALVGPDLEEGRKFLALLRAEKVPVNAALWQWNETSGEWSLDLVTPLVEDIGLKETYRRLQHVISHAPQQPKVDLLNVSLFTPDAWFSKSLHRELRGVRDRRITKRPVGDHFVEDGFIYFVK